jgi:hypothetical protein
MQLLPSGVERAAEPADLVGSCMPTKYGKDWGAAFSTAELNLMDGCAVWVASSVGVTCIAVCQVVVSTDSCKLRGRVMPTKLRERCNESGWQAAAGG